MRTPRVPSEEQYQLIMECRRSGLSDQQWCLNHDIKPGTFYNWVKRLRQKGERDIPAATGRASLRSVPQEVVKIELNKAAVAPPVDVCFNPAAIGMEMTVGSVRLHIPNGTDPLLLTQTLKVLTELIC